MDVPEREHLLPTEVGTLLRRGLSTLKRWRDRGVGPAWLKLENGHILYPREAVEAYIARVTQGTAS